MSLEEERALYSERAYALGVDPTEPDDHKFWSKMDRNKAVLATFNYHVPTPEQIARITDIRRGAKEFAACIMRNVDVQSTHPYGVEDFNHAIRLVHEAMMTANKSIVNEQK